MTALLTWDAATKSGLASDEEILEALAAGSETPIANSLVVSAEARDSVPERFARRFGILPLAISDAMLDVATSNPFDLDCEKTLAFATGRKVRMLLSTPSRIAERIEEVYAPLDRVNQPLDKTSTEAPTRVAEVPGPTSEPPLDEHRVERPVIKLVDHIVAEGIAAAASDIHLEAGENGIAVRYRIDGMLKEVMVLSKAVGIPLVSRIKIMSGMDIADRLRPQGGRALVSIKG